MNEEYVTIKHLGRKVKVSLEGTLIAVDGGGAYYVEVDDEDKLFQIRDPKDIQLIEEE